MTGPETTPERFVHESCYVGDDVEIGAGTKVWHFCNIRRGARLGRDCNIGAYVEIGVGVAIGDRVKIQTHATIPEGVTFEDDVFCGPGVMFTNVERPRAAFPQPRGHYRKTLVARGATLGASVTVTAGRTIGAHALVGAGSVVTRDVPAHALVYGNPARLRGWVCACGQTLALVGSAAACGCGRRYERHGEGLAEV